MIRELSIDDFECDGAVQAGVARFVDLTHSASADWSHDLVRADLSPGINGIAG